MKNSVTQNNDIKGNREIFQLAEMLSIFSGSRKIVSSSDIVAQMSGHRTTRYSLLTRAEVLGLIESRGFDSEHVGPPTRLFALSKTGLRFHKDIPELLNIRKRFLKILSQI